MVWITPDAPSRLDVAQCVSCGLCLGVCPTYELTGDESASPRGRLAAIAAVADGVAPLDDTFEEVVDFCLQCRSCEAACPALVPFGKIIEGARTEIAIQRPSASRTAVDVLVGKVVASPGLMRLGASGAGVARRTGLDKVAPGPVRRLIDGLRDAPAERLRGAEFPAVGEQVGTAALLLGCVMEAGFAPVHTATIEVLRRAGYRVVVPASQTCCGALAAHTGDAPDAHRLARQNVEAFAGVDVVVADAAGCSSHLKEYERWAGADGAEVAARTRDVVEVVAAAIGDGRLPRLDLARGPVAVQDPCHLRHAQRIVDEPRLVLQAAGYTPVEIDDKAMCCGAAGAWGMLHPEASELLGDRKADQVRASGSTVVASANPGCELQLRTHLDEWYEIKHPVELYWEALADAERGR